MLNTKTVALLFFAVVICGIAAFSIERSIRLSGQAKEQEAGSQKAKLQAQIEQQKSEIEALPLAKTSAERLSKAEMMEELGILLWQDQKLKESLDVLTKALALEKEGGAGNDRIVATLNQIATVCRDSNKYADILAALRQIQTLNEHDPASTPEIRIRDKQNMASCNFLLALQEAEPSKKRQQLQLTQTTMEELKRELLQARSTEKLNPGERSLLATINENLASVCEELGDTAAAKPLKEEAQTLRSANR